MAQSTPGTTRFRTADARKQAAGEAAADLVDSGMALGLGTGSTVYHFLHRLADRIRQGQLQDVRGVPTSVQTTKLARSLGIPLATLEELPALDLAVDGADEVDPDLNLIKGLGGALLREKMIVQASRRFVVIADDAKCVERLGTRSPVPVEVVSFGAGVHEAFFRSLGADPRLRLDDDGDPFVTDNGNFVYHCHFPEGLRDPVALARRLALRAGVVETGLFLEVAHEALVGTAEGVEHRVVSRQRAEDS